MVPTSGEGRGIFHPRARYFPWMESTQRSPGLRTRTRGARLGRTSNLFGAGMNLGPLRPPPAAARAGQIRRSFFHNIAPLVYLAFSDLFGRGRCPHRPASGHRPPYNTHNIRSSYAVGRDDPARLVITTTPPHPSSPTAMPPSPLWVEGLGGGPVWPPLQILMPHFRRRPVGVWGLCPHSSKKGGWRAI